jgi:hypothetical protein
MKNNFAVCYLAYDDEHINEFNYISKSLLELDNFNIFVCTNNKYKIIQDVNIIETKEFFNFNLKRKSIEIALKKFDIILVMDTDYKIINKNIDFSFLYELNDGIYVKWFDNMVDFMGEKMSSSDNNNLYINKLYELNTINNELFFIDECIFLLKISDEIKKNNFIENWNNIFNETVHVQPNNGKNGAIEGLIIYLSCLLSGIDIYKVDDYNKINNLFNKFYHYSQEINKEKIYSINKTLI